MKIRRKKIMKKKFATLLLGLGIAQSTLLAAETKMEEARTEQKKPQPTFLPGEPLDPKVVPAGIPVPNHAFRQRDMNVYADAYFLYWHAYNISAQVGTRDTANANILGGFPPSLTNRLNIRTAYRPGVRVGVGADFGPGVVDVTYTRYHHAFSSHYSGEEDGSTTVSPAIPIVGLEFQAPLSFQKLKAHYLFHYDNLVVSGQKEIYARPKLQIKAAYGIDGILQKQEFKIKGITPGTGITGLVRADHRFWGVGPFLGMRLRGLMSFGLRVIGNLEFSLDYVRIYKGKSDLRFPTSVNPLLNNEQIYARPVANWLPKQEAALGLGWEKRYDNNVRINIAATYNWIGMWLYGPSLWEAHLLGGGYLHGLQVGGQVDF
jgi:hypothetical protein